MVGWNEKLIVIEGLNGSGKETQAEMLKYYLEKKYKLAKKIEFPIYELPSGQLLRRYLDDGLNKEKTYFNALVYELNRFEIMYYMHNLLDKNYWIVLDRYIYSNWTFQKILANDDKFLGWIKAVEDPLPKPKQVVFLDVPIEMTIQLMKTREKRDWHETDTDFMKKVYKEYKKIAKEEDWIVIDCMKDGKLLSKEEIHKDIIEKLYL